MEAMLQYKQQMSPSDQRRVLVCGLVDDKRVHVDWMPPAQPGVDSEWEMQFHSLVRAGAREDAVRFLQRTRALTRTQALAKVQAVVDQLDHDLLS